MGKKIKLVKKKCDHNTTEFEFSLDKTRKIHNYLVINGLTVMSGTCPECGEYVEEIATAGLFELEEKPVKKNDKRQNNSIKHPVDANNY